MKKYCVFWFLMEGKEKTIPSSKNKLVEIHYKDDIRYGVMRQGSIWCDANEITFRLNHSLD
jgi:hypothetical protein